MDADKDKGSDKVHLRGWSSQEALRTYKRRRQPEPEPEPEPKPVAVPEQQVTDTFWKSRDIGWKHGIMIDENRQHWKCMYCHLTRYGGGVSRLKRHLAGDLDVKMCPKVPADVAEKIREHLQKKRERRKKRAAQNDADSATRSFADNSKAEKDPLPVDLEVPTQVDTCVLEEVTNQTNEGHQEPTIPEPPLLLRGVRDIGWEHAVDLDGNKKRWQCKWCDLCRSGGVTTLKAHLTDSSCPKIPMEMSKKVLNFIEEKRAARQLFNKEPWPVYKKIDWVSVYPSGSEKEGTVPCKNDQQPSNNAMHMLTSEKCTIDELAAQSSQCGREHSGQLVENYEQSKKSSDRSEEQSPMEHDSHHVLNNEHQNVDKNTENSQSKEKLKLECHNSIQGGVITLNAHLNESSCQKLPVEMKKVSNFVEDKREASNLFNSDTSPPCKKIDWDILITGAEKVKTSKKEKIAMQNYVANRLRYSLRAYASILYLRVPDNFRIILRGRDVEPHNVVNDLMYRECVLYKPQIAGLTELSIVTTIGFVKGAPDTDVQGFNVYHKNRLITPFWKVASNSYGKGRGVVGILDASFIKPTHDKQDFEKSVLYQRLENRLKEMTYEYWGLHCHRLGYDNKALPKASRAQYRAKQIDAGGSPASASLQLLAADIPTSSRAQSNIGLKRNFDALGAITEINNRQTKHRDVIQRKRFSEHKTLTLENDRLRDECLQYEESEKQLTVKEQKLRYQIAEERKKYEELLEELKLLDVKLEML